MSPLTIKLLTAGGLLGLYYLTRSSASPTIMELPPGPAPGPGPAPQPAPVPRGIPDREHPEVFPVDQISGPGYYPYPVRRRRYGWPWY